MNLLPALVLVASVAVYIVSGFPLKPDGPPETPEEFLDHLANMVFALNSSVIPSNLRNLLPRYHLLNCITSEQREVIKYCHNNTKQMFKSGSISLHLPPPPEVAIECILNKMGALMSNTTGQTVVDNASKLSSLKKAVIERSSLAADQKRAAEASLETCMSSNITLPSLPPPPPLRHHVQPPSADEIHNLMNGNMNSSVNNSIHPLAVLKLTICLAKALIQNGCADSNKTSAALMMIKSPKILVHRHVWEIEEEDLIGSNGTVIDHSVKKVLHREEWQEGKPGLNGSNPVKTNATAMNKLTIASSSNNSNLSSATVNSTITVVDLTNITSSTTSSSTTSTASPKPISSAPLVDGSINATTTKISSLSPSTSTTPTTLVVPSNTTSTNKPTLSSTPDSTLAPTTTNIKLPSSPLTLAPRPPPPPPTVYGQDLLPNF